MESYKEGALLMLTIDTAVEFPAQLIVYKDLKTSCYMGVNEDDEEEEVQVNTLTYYPITDKGLEVAKTDNGSNPSSLHRQTKYTASNIHDRNLLEMDPGMLRGYQLELYNNILSEL